MDLKNEEKNSKKYIKNNLITTNLRNIDLNETWSDEEDYECEMCLKKISYEEYELYDGMCEECFEDTFNNEQKNY